MYVNISFKKIDLVTDQIKRYTIFEWDLRSNNTYMIFNCNMNSIAGTGCGRYDVKIIFTSSSSTI